ncbi:MAG: hypothetical protein HQL58_05870 [Magnetococcales bacterium]|nr:hypothetical protein [Magnetococcales bacterium]
MKPATTVYQPTDVVRRALMEVLREIDRDRHLALWNTLLEEDPSLVRKLEMLLAREISAVVPAAAATQPRQLAIDPALFRREAEDISFFLHGRGYEYGMGRVVYDRLEGLLSRIRPLLEEDDGVSALAALDAIVECYTYEWMELEDDGELSSLFEEMGEMIAEALLRADLSSRERSQWQERLLEWQGELADYGAEEGISVAIRAASEGWDDARLQAILQGTPVDSSGNDEDEYEDEDEDEYDEYEDEDASGTLIRIRLAILGHRGRHEEQLRLARFYGEYEELSKTLCHLGRVEEAEAVALTCIESPSEMHRLAQLFHQQGDLDRALRVAEQGLLRTGSGRSRLPGRLDLARWLRDVAHETGNLDLALRSAETAFNEAIEMSDYLAIEALAGDGWPAIRERLLEGMVDNKAALSADNKIVIYLHEGRVDQAVRVVEKSYISSDVLLRELMLAAMGSHADWVIQRSRAEADTIMNAGKAAHYDVAAEWLGLTRMAYLQAGRQAEWASVLASIIEKHVRKYKLKPLLEKLK